MDTDDIIHMEKFAGTVTGISLKNHHTWGCTVYVLDAISQDNIYGLPRSEPRSPARIYLVISKFHAGSIALVLKTETGHVSPQFNVVFVGEFYTVPFMKECTVTPIWTDLVQCSSQIGAPKNIDLRDNWFTPDLE